MKKIIYFDGVCNLCNWSVRLIIKNDKEGIFSFASLQSDFAKKHLLYLNGQDIKFDSVVYQNGEVVLIKSEAVFQIVNDFGGIWKGLAVFRVIPQSWLDGLYDVIAKNRYRWFGKMDQCMVPTPEIQSRFLD